MDTHVFIWFVNDDPQLKAGARALISDPYNDILVSVASLWEMAIKYSQGKLSLQPDYVGFIAMELSANSFESLPITQQHLYEIARMPFHHKDPFDRLIIVQSQVDRIPLISADSAFDAYGIQRLFD